MKPTPVACGTPTAIPQRIHSLDTLRGVAVFGILVVNLEQMFLPMFYANSPVAAIPGEIGFQLAWLVTDAFFENKFLTLFSLLFGAGFALQWQRAAHGGRGFVPRFLRRLLLLAVFGAIHATFFYAADVLIIYSLIALLLIPWRRASPRVLAVSGGALVALTVIWGAVISGPDPPDIADQKRAAAAAVAKIREFGQIDLPEQELRRPPSLNLSEHPDWELLEGNRVRIPAATYSQPLEPEVAETLLEGGTKSVQAMIEYSVYSEGPSGSARFVRLQFLARLLLLYTPFYLGWRTLGLFLLGAALVAAGRLEDRPTEFWKRWRFLGLAMGLPLSMAASVTRLVSFETQNDWVYAGHVMHDLSSLLLAAGIAGTVFAGPLFAGASQAESPFLWRRRFAVVGRLALTNYIGQSVVMSLLATSVGFGLFGDLTRLQLFALAILCFAGQILVSSWWASRFRSGPLEWIWRCFTYWRWLPLTRTETGPSQSRQKPCPG